MGGGSVGGIRGLANQSVRRIAARRKPAEIQFMHISEGILSGPVLLTGAAVAAAGTAAGLKRLEFDKIPETALLTAAFFVASLVHLPVGPGSVHLVMNGVVGLLLGWTAFPAILTALLLQAVLFQFGGLTVLGVNTVIMAAPAVGCHYLFRRTLYKGSRTAAAGAFFCGFTAVLLSVFLMSACLVATTPAFFKAAGLAAAFNLPVMVVEGVITAFLVSFLKKVQPEALPLFSDNPPPER
jgi:cobalt/nickel transport system permease protein